MAGFNFVERKLETSEILHDFTLAPKLNTLKTFRAGVLVTDLLLVMGNSRAFSDKDYHPLLVGSSVPPLLPPRSARNPSSLNRFIFIY